MCDPASIGMALTIGSTVLGFKQQMNAASANESAADANRQIHENNAELMRREADDAIVRGNIKEENRRRKTIIDKGKQIAKFGSSGFQIGDVTSSDILADTEQFGELDALTIRENAKRESDLHNQRADNELFAGGAAFDQGMNKAKNNRIGAFGTLITGGGQVADKWYQLADKDTTSKPITGTQSTV